MPLDVQRLSKIIFGPVGICDENRGDQIFQPLSHDLPDLDESSFVLIADVVATALRGAAFDDQEDIGLLKEFAECAAGTRTQISEPFRQDAYKLEMCGYMDKEGLLNDKAIAALKFAVLETGIANLPVYKNIVGKPGPA